MFRFLPAFPVTASVFTASVVIVSVLGASGGPARAQVRLEGWFIAFEACEVYQSKNSLTNPGDLRAQLRHAYDMIGRNTETGDWYQVTVPGAPVTTDRWIHQSCGRHVTAASPVVEGGETGDFDPPTGTEATDLLLAVSWQPAFCEQRPNKAECRQVNDGRLPITETQLSLHGLWPQPRGVEYCGVPSRIRDLDRAGRWADLPAPALDADTAERLAIAMPGTASFLERHEWIKHGTCFFGDGGGDGGGDAYYDDSLRVLKAINMSPVGALLADSVGGPLSGADLRAAFDAGFGDGAGDRVTVECTGDDGRVLVQELKIAIRGEITETADIGALIRAADPRSPGCAEGIIDPAGLQ